MTEHKPTNCFVGIFDILGFKSLRRQEGTEKLYKKFCQSVVPMAEYAAAGALQTISKNGTQVSIANRSPSSCSQIIFSDTILLWSPDNSLESFLRIVFASRELVKCGFGIKQPVRGAIGYGDAIMGPLAYVGSAIEDAYENEKIQVWSGCMLTTACLRYISSQDYINLYAQTFREAAERATEGRKEMLRNRVNDLTKYEIPICRNPKSGPANYSNIDALVIDWVDELHAGVAEQAFLPSNEPHAKQIVENTLAFEKWARNKRAI